jgi:hypothetical protein
VPVVHVRSLVPPGGDAQVDRALASIAGAVARAIDGDPAGTWCTFAPIEHLTIGDRTIVDEGRIVFVDLWMRPRGDDRARDALVAASSAAADGFGVPVEDVWAALRPVEAGRVFAGGEIVAG